MNTIFRQLLFVLLCGSPMMLVAAEKVINVSASSFDAVAYFPQGSSPATVVSLNDSILAAQIESAIDSIPVKVGDTVNKGQTLVQLDCRVINANHESAKARYSLAQYQLQRAQALSKSNHVSEEVLRTRKSELEVARAALATTRVDVGRCQVQAPFSGVVAERIAAVGEWVNRGQALLRLIDLDDVEVSTQIADSIIASLDDIREFKLVINNQLIPVTLRAISKSVDNLSRTREVRFTFAGEKAYPGQSGRIVWQSTRRYLPADYLVKRNQKYGVFIVNDDQAHFIEVRDAQEGRPFHIDLEDNTQLITRGRYSVQNNDRINVIR